MRRNFKTAKRVIVAITAASMVMSQGIPAMAEGVIHNRTEVDTDKSTHAGNSAEKDKASSISNDAAVEASSTGGESSAKITGDVVAENSRAENDAYQNGDEYDATGVDASSKSSDSAASTSVEVGGDVSASSINEKATVTGISASSESGTDKSDATATTTVDVKGDVSAAPKDTNATSDTNKPTVKEAIGVDASSKAKASDATTTVTVGGDITVKNKLDSTGIDASATSSGAKSTVNVTVKGTTEVYSDTSAVGINIETPDQTNTDSNISVDVGGVYVFAHEKANAYSIKSKGNTGDVNVKVGSVQASAQRGDSYGVYIKDNANKETITTGDISTSSTDGTKYGVYSSGTTGEDNIKVNGMIYSTSNSYNAYVDDAKGTVDIDVEGKIWQYGGGGAAVKLADSTEATKDTSIEVSVTEDIISFYGTAIEIDKNTAGSNIDVAVEGTVQGASHTIVVNEDSSGKVNTDNLNITVWKIGSNSDGSIVESKKTDETYSSKTTTTEAIEKSINYIIKIDESSKNGLAVNGTKDANGYNTAHEGEKVYLKVTVPDGYSFKSFYNAEGANGDVNVVTGSDGQYYLVVPRGGGVQVGVNFEKNANQAAPSAHNTPVDISGDVSNSGDAVNPSGTVNPSNTINTVSYRESSGSDSSSSDGDSRPNPSNNSPAARAEIANTQMFNNVVNNLQAQGIDTTNFFRVSAMDNTGNALSFDVNEVLKPVDTLAALNNFSDSGLSNPGTANVKGAGVVSFGSMFANSATGTVNVPVVSQVSSGNTYTIALSDGTTMTVQCVMDGVLNIPFASTADGLTFIIYGASMDPSLAMMQAMQESMTDTTFGNAADNVGLTTPDALAMAGLTS